MTSADTTPGKPEQNIPGPFHGQSPRQNLSDALASGGLVLDGAMGTALYSKGLLYSRSMDAANLDQANLVAQVHGEYVAAGAQVVTANTFGANRFRLRPHGLENKVRDINVAGIQLARTSNPNGWVLGSMGPTGMLFGDRANPSTDQAREGFLEQAQILVECGVDGLVLETFRQPQELQLALDAVRELQTTFPVIACVSFDPQGTLADGTPPEAVADSMVRWGATAIGVNCADGPAGVYEMVIRMGSPGVPVVAVPNAGLPKRVDGRFAYMATPEYFQLYARRLFKAGISAVGGCCGTTPDHIRKIAAAARMVGSHPTESGGGGARDPARSSAPTPSGAPSVVSPGGRPAQVAQEGTAAPGVEVVPTEKKGPLPAKLGKQFVVSVEINPPAGMDLSRALRSARTLQEGGVDVINVADGPRASVRMGNMALCLRIQDQLGMPSLMHVTTRDRNLLGLVAHLMASHELGLRNLVVITGDPPKMGDFPDASAVYDTDSIGLLRVVNGLNHGRDPGGKPLQAATSFFCATGAEPAAVDFDREVRRLHAKVQAGAEMIMTQPVYDPDVLDRFLKVAEPLGIPVLVGLLPLASAKNAEFIHNEVPGMRIPTGVRERMGRAGSGDPGRREGVAIAREMLEAVKDRVQGAYIMPPFGRTDLALQVIEGIVR